MIEILDRIWWIGIKDWSIRRFHGFEMSTHRGTTYNSYIIKDEKTVLVDTVWDVYADKFMNMLEEDVGISAIDMIVINHIEPDHGGSLGRLMEMRPELPIYCTKNGAEIIRRHFHKDWDFHIVATGDKINVGKYNLVFVEMQMIHWPDSMMTYVDGASLVLSNDAFGQHYAPVSLFNDEVDACELYQEALKYYANILSPFTPLIMKKIDQVKALGLPIKMIAPSHGVIWRRDPIQIIDKYYEWANTYSEDFTAVIYDTMYNSTKAMAEAIAKGMEAEGVKCKLFNCATTDQSDLLLEIFKAKGIVMGCCTVNNTVLRSIAGLLDEIKGHKFRGKAGAAFGSYGWSGEAGKIIAQDLNKAGFDVAQQPLQFRYRPSDEELGQCISFGSEFAARIHAMSGANTSR